MSSVSEIEN